MANIAQRLWDLLTNRLTGARAGYLDNINNAQLLNITLARLQAIDKLLATATDGTEPANTISKLIYEIGVTRLTLLRAGYLDSLSAGATSLRASQLRELYTMDFWSNPQEEVSIPAIAATLALPSVTVADLPAGATVVRAIALLKFRAIENTNVAANKLFGATVAATSQVLQVRSDAPGVWRDAINFVDDQFGLAASTREGGDVLAGSIDIAVEVTANDIYEFRYLLALADLASLNWNDVVCGLRVTYSV